MATNNNSNTNNNTNTGKTLNLGGAFSQAGIQNALAKRVQNTLNGMTPEALPALHTNVIPQGIATAKVDGAIEDDGSREDVDGVALEGKDFIKVYRNDFGVAWGMKWCNPTANRNELGKNVDGKTLTGNAKKSESRVKDILSALSMITRNTVVSANAALIVESGKILVNFRHAGVQVIPVVVGGSVNKPIVLPGKATIVVGDQSFSVTYNTSLNLQTALQTKAGWIEFQAAGSVYHLAHFVAGNQESIYEFLIQILSTGCDVWLTGLDKWVSANAPEALINNPKFAGYYDVKLNRFHTFSMYFDLVFKTISATNSVEANASYNVAMKDAATAAVNHGIEKSGIMVGVNATKAGEVTLFSELIDQTIVLDTAWLVCEAGVKMLKALGKKAVSEKDGITTLDLAKIDGNIIISPLNAETHAAGRGVSSLKICTTAAAKLGEGKAAVINAATDEGKQDLKAITVLNTKYTFKVAWSVVVYTPATK